MVTYDDLLTEFKEWVTTDATVQNYWRRINNGLATYRDAERYSEVIGRKWSELLTNAYGTADYSEIVNEITNSLGKAYGESAYFAKSVQEIVNSKAGIGMKALEPAVDSLRIDNLINKLIEEQGAEKTTEWMLGSDVISNISRSAVTDTISYNARTQSEAGINAYLVRDPGAGCCEWCNSIAGTYEFGKQPSDFWRVHKDCTCNIEYKPSKYQRAVKIRYENGRKITT